MLIYAAVALVGFLFLLIMLFVGDLFGGDHDLVGHDVAGDFGGPSVFSSRIMAAFNDAVETKNTINQISIDKPTPHAAGATPLATGPALGTTTASEHRFHEVIAGDTLSGLAKKYYGDASKYNRIFEANRDQLNDPDKINVGQRLKIPT